MRPWTVPLMLSLPLVGAEGPGVPPATLTVTSPAGTEGPVLTTPVAVHTIEGARVTALASPWIGTALNEIPGVYQASLRGLVDVPAIRMPLSF